MHRIDAPGFAPGNLFTEGNPSLSVPSTEVSDDWLNDIQENMCQFIENQGITLVKGTYTQLEDALALYSASGSGGQLKQTLLNNQSSAVNVTGLVYSSVTIKAFHFKFDIERRTDSSSLNESGQARASFDNENSVWTLDWSSSFDDALAPLEIDASSGQIKYTSSNLAGASYDGNIRVSDIKTFDQ